MTSVLVDHDIEAFIDRMIASGRYETRYDVLRTALQLLCDQEALREMKQAELAAMIEEGLEDVRAGRLIDADEVFRDIEALIEEKAAQRRDAAE